MIVLRSLKQAMSGVIQLTGSKSISNRLLVMNEVLNLGLSFKNLSNSEDTRLLLQALEFMKKEAGGTINIHHAGTDMRFLTALLSCKEGEWILSGSERLKERPIKELVTALVALGADITYLEKDGFPPLKIKGKQLAGGSVEVDSSISSQFVSALLLVAPILGTGLNLKLSGTSVSRPYIMMTVDLLRSYGIKVEFSDNVITVLPLSTSLKLSNRPMRSVEVESDWSSASYWYSMCALSPNSEIKLTSLNKESLQADSVLPKIYAELGVTTVFREGTVVLSQKPVLLKEFNFDFSDCPDIAQTLAVCCFGLGIKARLSGLSTLKVKETDRIFALKQELEKFGAGVIITEESLELKAFPENNAIIAHTICTYNDHRMAMSFAPLALKYSELRFDDAKVVDKSYPGFWEDLKSVGFSVNLQA